MSLKETFTVDEWAKIRDTPNLVALATAMAGSSGRFQWPVWDHRRDVHGRENGVRRAIQ